MLFAQGTVAAGMDVAVVARHDNSEAGGTNTVAVEEEGRKGGAQSSLLMEQGVTLLNPPE